MTPQDYIDANTQTRADVQKIARAVTTPLALRIRALNLQSALQKQARRTVAIREEQAHASSI